MNLNFISLIYEIISFTVKKFAFLYDLNLDVYFKYYYKF